MARLGIWLIIGMLLAGAKTMAELEFFAIQPDSTDAALANNGERWRLFSDRVMGGVSTGELTPEEIVGRSCLRMQGDVSLENNGGFVQIAIDLGDALPTQLPDYTGIALDVYGNNESYNLHLRTDGMRRPWQSYRATFEATPEWQTIKLPFSEFEAHRYEAPLDVSSIRRIGIVAIGRAFEADLCLGRVTFYE